MNAFSSTRSPAEFLLAVFLLCLGLATGCASKPKIDWDSRVGSYTHDEAVLDLGPPDKTGQLSDGSTVAEWYTVKKSRVSFSFGVGSYGSHGGVGVGQTVSPGPGVTVLRLTFGPDGKLLAWRRQ